MKISAFDRLIRKTIFEWRSWYRGKLLLRNCRKLADLNRKEADERARHGRPAAYTKAKRDLVTDLLAGRR